MVELYNGFGVCVKEVAVCLYVYLAFVFEELAVFVEEVGACKTLVHFLHLWVREREPYTIDFIFTEEIFYCFDVGAQECNITQAFLQRLSCACPHSCSLDIDSDEVYLWVQSCESYGVFPLTAAEFEEYRVVVAEILFTPMSLHIERNIVDNTIWILEHILIAFHVSKLC